MAVVRVSLRVRAQAAEPVSVCVPSFPPPAILANGAQPIGEQRRETFAGAAEDEEMQG